jgi:hypothetical protein
MLSREDASGKHGKGTMRKKLNKKEVSRAYLYI